MKVKAYFNLHKKIFSVQHNGLVIGHANHLVITNPQFKVSEAGRQRVLREKRKNVHAFVIGEVADDWKSTVSKDFQGEAITYNPYKYSTFVKRADESPIHAAASVQMIAKDGRASMVAVFS
jgi:hypothetical protein